MSDSASSRPQLQSHEDSVKELVWVLRRMMYMFIRWAEKKYGWSSSDR